MQVFAQGFKDWCHFEIQGRKQLFDIVSKGKMSFQMQGVKLDVEPTDAVFKEQARHVRLNRFSIGIKPKPARMNCVVSDSVHILLTTENPALRRRPRTSRNAVLFR